MRTERIVPVLLVLSLGLALSGCGSNGVTNSGAGGTSGGGSTGTTGSTGPNSLLSGKYAFNFTGTATQTGTPVLLVGSFTADGNGNITAGEEDLNVFGGIGGGTGKSVTGTYTIGTDGRGTLNFTSISQTFKIAVENNNHGQLIRFDSGAAGSGTFDLQSATALSALNQTHYVFEWNGYDSGDNPYSAVGNVTLSGGNASGAMDFNDAGANSGDGQSAVSFQLGTPDSNGLGTATIAFASTNFAFGYVVVSSSRILLLETDLNAAVVGEADTQSAGTLAPSGAYALYLNGVNQEYVLGGQIVAGAAVNGSIPITSSNVEQNVQFDVVNASYPGTFTPSDSITGGTVNDRFTLVAPEPDTTVNETFVVYMVSANQAMIMETDADQVTFGQMLSQTSSSFSAASLSGNYGINFFGLDANTYEGDFMGQFTSGGTSTVTGGTLDINDEDINPATLANNTISGGSYSVVNGSTGQGTLSFTVTGVTDPFVFTFYFVSPSQIILVETDQLFVGLGSALTQPTIP